MIEIKELRTDIPAPNFRLQSTSGREVELVKYRGRQPLVLYFVHDGECTSCQARLKTFAELYSDFQEEKVELLVIVSGSIENAKAIKEQLGLPYPLLADAEGKASAAYLGGQAAGQFVLDRYTTPQVRETGADADAFMKVSDALSWAAFSDTTCAGCV